MSTGTGIPAPAPTEPQGTTSPMTRVLQTIYAPTKAFVGLNGKTAWILPWIIISVITLAFFVTVDKKIGFDTVVENQIRMSPKMADQLERMPEAQRDQQIHMRTIATKYGSYFAPITILIMYAVIALVLWGTFTFAAGARLTFWSTFSVLFLAAIPGIIKTILSIITVFAGIDPEGFNISNPVATNLSVLFDHLNSPFLNTLGSFVDVFVIWSMIVLAIGFTIVSKAKRSTSMSIVFGWYAVIALVAAGVSKLLA